MSKKEIDKDVMSVFDAADDINPYASYLGQSTLSSVDSWIDTGSMVLNALISGSLYGGVPKGRVTQFCGPSQTFKSGFILKILANAQKEGMQIIIFDTEGEIDPESAASFGLDIDRVKYYPSNCLEVVRNSLHKIQQKITEKKLEGKFIVAIDSLANLQSEMELKRMDKESTSADMGSFAKACKSLLKTATAMSTLTRTPVLITNHVYDDPSAMYPSLEKNMAGGKAAIYLPSVTVQLGRKLVKDDGGKTVESQLAASQKSYSGVVIRALTVKNRFIKQYLEGELYLSFSTGINKYYGLLEIMKGMGVVSNSGASYTDWEGNKLGFYGKFKKDIPLWEERLLPELEKRIKKHWAYGSDGNEDVPDEDFEDEDSNAEVTKTKGKKNTLILEDEAPDEE